MELFDAGRWFDEAQDLLLDSYLDVIDASLKRGLNGGCWRVFLDPNQNIYWIAHRQGGFRASVSDSRLGIASA